LIGFDHLEAIRADHTGRRWFGSLSGIRVEGFVFTKYAGYRGLYVVYKLLAVITNDWLPFFNILTYYARLSQRRLFEVI
jgi:hypothetical protein